MAMSVKASRFSLLPDDDDDLNKKALKNKVLKKNAIDEKSSNENDAKAKKNKNKKKKKKVDTDDKDLQALAYGKKVDQNLKRDRASSSMSTASEVNDEDFAKWVSHDQMMTDETFAKDLQAAILASKIENMQQKLHQKLSEETKKQSKKPIPMSLQDFNKMDLNGGGEFSQPPEECDNVKETFFEDVEEASKIAFNREQTRESLQQRYSDLPDQALLKHYKSILHAKDEEIAQLIEQSQNLILERDKFKKRNKQYRDLLSQVESRDKAEVIGENIKLKHVQGEIALELATLREENEKLKTKLADKDKDLLKLKDRRKNSESK